MLTILLLPGMDGSGTFFSPFIDALGSTVKTEIISYPTDLALNYAELTQYVAQALPKEHPYILLGESFSGPIAVTLAANKPNGLRGVILVASFINSPISIPDWFIKIVCRFPVQLIPISIVAKYLLGNYANKAIKADLAKMLAQVPGKIWLTRLRAILTVNVRKEIAEINVPILCIRASQDKIVPKSATKLMTLHQRNIKIAVIKGPHFILQAKPSQTKIVLIGYFNFLGKIPQRSVLP